jgi:hypothetical protein
MDLEAAAAGLKASLADNPKGASLWSSWTIERRILLAILDELCAKRIRKVPGWCLGGIVRRLHRDRAIDLGRADLNISTVALLA